MKLYHSSFLAMISLIMASLVVSCTPPVATQEMVSASLQVDGSTLELQLPLGGTVQAALEQAGVSLDYLDRVEPAPFTIISTGDSIRVIRVREEFAIDEEVIPFERKMLQTESLPEQQTLLTQSGVNGLREITYRQVFEDGVEVSKYPVRSTIVKEAIPEIIMVGIQAAFVPVSISGKIAYILGSNAWVMEQGTGNRRPVVTSGDLDGRVFTLSQDGSRLLFTRRSEEKDQINSLWVANLSTDPVELYDLKVKNVVHYADFLPDSQNDEVIFSTVEPRSTAPGWQANNDLNTLHYSPNGWVSRWKVYVDANSGGVYGWWGTGFAIDPGSGQVAYARPDSVGLVNMDAGSFTPLIDIIPLQTGGDWAWIPGISWSPDGKAVFTVNHTAPPGSSAPEESKNFDLATVILDAGSPLSIVPQSGMFAYPVASPLKIDAAGESGYQIAYLQAIFPSQSETSRYRLAMMDRDGSDRRILFPGEGAPGIEPQRVAWSPNVLPESEKYAIAVVYQGNLWLVDPTGEEPPRQITGDGLVSRVDWK